jgi:hypothetical protein
MGVALNYFFKKLINVEAPNKLEKTLFGAIANDEDST